MQRIEVSSLFNKDSQKSQEKKIMDSLFPCRSLGRRLEVSELFPKKLTSQETDCHVYKALIQKMKKELELVEEETKTTKEEIQVLQRVTMETMLEWERCHLSNEFKKGKIARQQETEDFKRRIAVKDELKKEKERMDAVSIDCDFATDEKEQFKTLIFYADKDLEKYERKVESLKKKLVEAKKEKLTTLRNEIYSIAKEIESKQFEYVHLQREVKAEEMKELRRKAIEML